MPLFTHSEDKFSYVEPGHQGLYDVGQILCQCPYDVCQIYEGSIGNFINFTSKQDFGTYCIAPKFTVQTSVHNYMYK